MWIERRDANSREWMSMRSHISYRSCVSFEYVCHGNSYEFASHMNSYEVPSHMNGGARREFAWMNIHSHELSHSWVNLQICCTWMKESRLIWPAFHINSIFFFPRFISIRFFFFVAFHINTVFAQQICTMSVDECEYPFMCSKSADSPASVNVDECECSFMCYKFMCSERWGAGVETQKNVLRVFGGWGRVPFNEPYAPSLSTIYDGA